MKTAKPKIGIGACLVGQPVRYNGDSKRQNKEIERLKEHITLKSFCPEMAIGLGVPRETVRLVGDLETTRLTDSATQTADYTAPIKAYAADVLANNHDLDGYILVKGSPSCGFARVKRYNEKGNVNGRDATGSFTAALKRLDPLLPLEEDGRLNDHGLRENFITRVYAYKDWKEFCKTGVTHHRLTAFWARYKYIVMAHHVPSYQEIGRLLANPKGKNPQMIADEFAFLLMHALTQMTTRRSHGNVLQHILGYLKKDLGNGDRSELSALIEQYRSGTIPLVVPLTLLKHHFKNFHHAYVDQQVFMQPYPGQLGLRNNI
jgi:uncharacterized protein YbgA (DUF1722 family)/uncharacterized protein YbbK (DUF523 family)